MMRGVAFFTLCRQRRSEMVTYEIVWTYLGEEYLFAAYNSKAEALASFHGGQARVYKLIHGGSMRVDEVVSLAT
jgi:hypothetical protein